METEDGLRITPKPLQGGLFRTYDDHRMAMAAAVLGLRVPSVVIENVETTDKTLPEFTARWTRMVDGNDGEGGGDGDGNDGEGSGDGTPDGRVGRDGPGGA